MVQAPPKNRTAASAVSPPPTPASPAKAPQPPPTAAAQNPAPGKLTLIGAGHVFQIREVVQESILALQPDIVFIELDRGRLQGLLAREQGTDKDKKDAGGFVHSRLAKFQESVAGMYGAEVGDEMLGAVHGAQAVGARVSLIDDPGQETLARAIKQLTWREKFRGVGMALGGLAKSAMPKNRRNAKGQVEEELRRYQEDPNAVMEELRAKFPTIHRVLIAERDQKMAARIRRQLAGARHGVAVLGDGHLNGMMALLQDLSPTVYRLADVREGRLPRRVPHATGTPEKIGFSFETRA